MKRKALILIIAVLALFLLLGTKVNTLVNLTTDVAGSGAYPSAIGDNSAFAYFMAIDADISDYDEATDSLEAIGTAVQLNQDYLDNTSIVVGRTYVATCTTTAAATTDNMFDVGGAILITGMFGCSTAAAAGSPGDMSLEFDATAGAAYDSDLSTSVTVDALGEGDTIHFTNAIDEGVLDLTANVAAGQPLSWIINGAGTIEQTLTSTGTLGITWYMVYIPLTDSSTVVPSS